MTEAANPPNQDATEPTPAPRLRASDADRAATVGILQEAMGRGLLTHDEGDERMAAAFAARFRDELPPLTADLPSTPPPPEAAVGWRRLGSMLATQVRAEVTSAASDGLRSRRVLVVALAVVLLIGLLMTLGGLAVHGLFHDGYVHAFGRGRR